MKKLYNRKQKMMLAKNKKERILNPMDINSKWYTKSSINSTATFLATFSTHLYYDKLVAYGNVYPSFTGGTPIPRVFVLFSLFIKKLMVCSKWLLHFEVSTLLEFLYPVVM